jgi:GNAT superfamily N-acetyltransferase
VREATTGPYRTRSVNASDETAWRNLWQAYCDFYGVSITAGVTDVLWRRIMDYRTTVHALVAETLPDSCGKTELVGFANYVLHPYTWGTDLICYLEDLFVLSHARGKGAGTALIEALVHLSRENGWPRLYWHTHKSNEVARALYDRFTPVDPFVRYVIRIR